MKPTTFIPLMTLLLAAGIASLVLCPGHSRADATPTGAIAIQPPRWFLALPLVDGKPTIADCNEGEVMLERGQHRLWLCDSTKRWWSLTP